MGERVRVRGRPLNHGSAPLTPTLSPLKRGEGVLWRWFLILQFMLTVLPAGAAEPVVTSPAAEIEASAERIVENFRKLIVLHDGSVRSRTPAASLAGRMLFFRNRELTAQLVEKLTRAPRNGDETGEQRVGRLLALFTAHTDWWDIDRIALLGVVNETRLRLPAGEALAQQLDRKREEISLIRAAYNNEFTAALASRAVSVVSGPRRAGWDGYLGYLRERYPLARVIDELNPAQPEEAATPRSASAEAAARDEWTDGGLPPKTVLLTFDDGPHPKFTAEILQILAHYNIRAVFFQVGQNLGVIRGGRAEPSRNANIVAESLRNGHAIGNHTYTHPLLPKLAAAAIDDEIDTTQTLLEAVAPAHAPLFRPPYGARNDLVLAEVADRGLRSVLWNIDSRDWADPIPQSIAQRVVDEAEREGRGIILFHDIHGRSVQALPMAIEGLLKRGFRFARWEAGVLTSEGAPLAAK